jgi:long-chain acyl-CoA synthetase
METPRLPSPLQLGAAFPLPAASEGRRCSRPFNRLRVFFDRSLTAANGLDLAFRAHPDSEVFHLDEPLPYRQLSGRDLTCRQLLGFVTRVGNVLQQAGMRRHDRVAIFKANSPDYCFLSQAIIRAGGIAVPINPGMQLTDLAYYLGSTGSRILITDADLFAERIGTSAGLPMVETWVFPEAPAGFSAPHVDLNRALEKASPQGDPVPLHSDSDVLIVHTSGTTGFPKGVISTSGSLVRAIKGHYLDEPIRTRNRSAIAAPFHHLVCQIGLYSSMLGNLPVWTVNRLDPDAAGALIDREQIHFFFAFPELYRQMYEAGLDRYSFSSVRAWISGADASHEAHMRAFCRKGAFLRLFGRPVMGSVFVDCLGSSEVGFAALRRFFFSFSKPGFRRLAGRPSPAAPRMKVADDEGRRLTAGKVGRLMVQGPTVFKGYWNAHDRLHGAMQGGWWWTGDVGYQDRRGRFYHLDRAADAIPTAAGPLYTLPLEEVLLSHGEVGEAVVFGVPSPGRGEVPCAVVSPKRGCSLDAAAYREWAKSHPELPIHLGAVVVVRSEEIPRGLTGKVLKRALRDRYRNLCTDAGCMEI